MFGLRFLPRKLSSKSWGTLWADIASVVVIAGLSIATVVLLSASAQPSLERTHWQFEAIAGQTLPAPRSNDSYLELLPRHDQLRGAIDGYSIAGHYQQLGVPRQLHLKPQPLPSSATVALNGRYLDALKKTRGETIDGRQLVLRDANGHPLARLRAMQRG